MANSLTGKIRLVSSTLFNADAAFASLVQNMGSVPPGVMWDIVNGDGFGEADDLYAAAGLNIVAGSPVTLNFIDNSLKNPANEDIQWASLKVLIISLPVVEAPILQTDGLIVGGGSDAVIASFPKFFPGGGNGFIDLTGLTVAAGTKNVKIDGTGNSVDIKIDLLAIGVKV